MPPLPVAQSLMMVLWSFATLRRPCTDLLEAASRQLQRPARLAAISPRHLPTLLWAIARLISVTGGGKEGGESGGSRATEGMGEAGDSGKTLAAAAGRRGLVMAGLAPLEVLRLAAAGPAAAKLRGMSAQGVVTLAWAYASSGVQPGAIRGEVKP